MVQCAWSQSIPICIDYVANHHRTRMLPYRDHRSQPLQIHRAINQQHTMTQQRQHLQLMSNAVVPLKINIVLFRKEWKMKINVNEHLFWQVCAAYRPILVQKDDYFWINNANYIWMYLRFKLRNIAPMLFIFGHSLQSTNCMCSFWAFSIEQQ